MTLKICFMGNPEIAVPFLDFLFKKKANLIVFTNKDEVRKRGKKLIPTPVKRYALEHGIPVFHDSSKTDKAYETIKDFAPDLLFVVAYGQIIPLRILNIPQIAPLNVHFSLLPKYRGPTPVNFALLNGETKTGTTIMYMDKGMDTGDIIYQKEIPIEPDDNATLLFEKLIRTSLELLNDNWESIVSNEFPRIPQDASKATYTRKITKEDLIINWHRKVDNIHNQIRAFNLIPGTKTLFREKTLFIEKAFPTKTISTTPPGTITEVTKTSLTVATRDRDLEILRVKPAGKKSMEIKSFIAGYRPNIGEKLG